LLSLFLDVTTGKVSLPLMLIGLLTESLTELPLVEGFVGKIILLGNLTHSAVGLAQFLVFCFCHFLHFMLNQGGFLLQLGIF
jgi:hypothetical protein